MTREEKTDKILNELLDDFIKAKLPLMKGMTLFAKVQNAVNYVANLSAEPCENCISRQAVLDLAVANHRELNGLNVVMYSPLYKDITQLPPVRPIRPKGEWEEYIDRDDYNDYESEWYVCSKCHHIQLAATNFCSNCGADMREVEK